MATLAQLQAQANDISARIRELTQRIREATSDAEGNRLLAERQQLRNALQEINRQIERIEVSAARSFRVSIDDNTGLVVIRTSDGLMAGRGNTLADAKEAAIRFNGADPAALANLPDPKAQAPAPPVSTGQTVAEAQRANDQGASTQAPATAPSVVDNSGKVVVSPATTVPSNATPTQPTVDGAFVAPPKLPSESVQTLPLSTEPTLRQPLQVANNDSNFADENTNLVSYVYRAVSVTSVFRQGKFTQEIDGAQIFFTLPPQRQNNQDLVRQTPTQQAAQASQQTNVRSEVLPNTTVSQTSSTPGVITSGWEGGYLGLAELGLDTAASPDASSATVNSSGAPASQTRQQPGSGGSGSGSTAAATVTVEGPDLVAPLIAQPATTGTGLGPRRVGVETGQLGSGSSSVASRTTSVQLEINTLRQQRTNAVIAIQQIDDRIARREGNLVENQRIRDTYVNNLQQIDAQLTALNRQLISLNVDQVSTPTTSVQLGAREF